MDGLTIWTEDLTRDLRKEAQDLEPESRKEVEAIAQDLEQLNAERRFLELYLQQLGQASGSLRSMCCTLIVCFRFGQGTLLPR